jgi:hypothetical protein
MLELGRLKQEDEEFKARLGYILRLVGSYYCLKERKKEKKKERERKKEKTRNKNLV